MAGEIWYRVVVDQDHQLVGICYGQGSTKADAITEIYKKKHGLPIGFDLMTGEPQGPFDSVEDAEKAYTRAWKA